MEKSELIESDIKQRFAKIALAPHEEKKFPIGTESAKRLGYAPSDMHGLPVMATESFCGVGNPFSLGELNAGETVLDLGCGAGMDSILAARRVSPKGKVIAVDFVREMLDKAQRNADAAGVTNIEFSYAPADNLPIPDNCVDVLISNGVFNLCVDKPKVLSEAYRVLRPGGRVQMADILLRDNVTPAEVEHLGTWSD